MRLLATVIAFLSLNAFAHLHTDSQSGIARPEYTEILALAEKWKATRPDLIDIYDYGTSVQGRTLRMVTLSKKGNFGKRSTLLMSGATHGNEYLNIEDRLPAEILKLADVSGPVSRFLDAGGVYVFVPILNPDGYQGKFRENANGVDLNRDWDVKPVGYQGFKEKETRLLAEALDHLKTNQNLRFQVTVDYHCCIGALLHPWSYPSAPELGEGEADKHRAVGELVSKHLKVEYGTTGQILGYYPVGTTKDYYFDKYRTAAFTYEGRYQKEPSYFEKHVRWWEEMTALVLGEPDLTGMPLASKKKRLFFLAD